MHRYAQDLPSSSWRGIARRIVEGVLRMHYAARHPATPGWARTAIYGGLAYVLSPIDFIPDFIPVIGVADDAGVLISAIAAILIYVTPEVKAQAAARARSLFGEG